MQRIIANYISPSYYSHSYFEEKKENKSFHTLIFDTFTNIPFTAYENLKDKFVNHSRTINTKLNEINNASLKNQKNLFIQALTSSDFHILRPELKNFFKKLNTDIQHEYLKAAVLESVRLRKNDLVTRCLHLLTESEMKTLIESKWIKNENPEFSQLIKNYLDCYEINAKYQPYDPTLAFLKSEIKALIPQVINFLLSIFDTLIMSTELFEVGDAPKSAWDASYQLDVYQKIISVPVSILWVLNAYFPNPVICGTAFIFTIAALGLAIYSYKWLKPMPNKLSKTTNLTENAEQGKISPVIARGLEITKVMNRLVQNLNSSDKEHILLIGDSGVGKTTIIEGLALKIASGNVPDELKGAKIFIINAAKLSMKDQITGKSPLDQIVKQMGDHKEKIILVIDEIQWIMQGDPSLRNEFLSLLDSSSQSIPLFIGITSTDQYEKNLATFKEPAIERRLKSLIEIKETDKDQTITIMKSMLQLYYPEVSDMSNELCEKIYKLNGGNKKSLEPLNSKGILSVLAEKIRSGLKGNNLTEELDALHAELEKAELPNVGPINPAKIFEPLNKINEIKKKIKLKEIEIQEYKKIVESYKSLKKQRRDREVFLKQLADKLTGANMTDELNQKILHQFLFESLYLIPAMEEELNAFASENNLQVEITKEMIEKTFPENPGYKSMTQDKEKKYTGFYQNPLRV
jgi:Cdc6-like AAA superfamily ATPase